MEESGALGLGRRPSKHRYYFQEWPRQTKPKKGQFMNFSQRHSGTKVQCESCLFSSGKTPEFTKMGEIHELFVLALSLVWFAGATPGIYCRLQSPILGLIQLLLASLFGMFQRPSVSET